jgi:hypothetical protein
MGQYPTFYLKLFDWLLCEVKQSFVRAPGDRRLTATSGWSRESPQSLIMRISSQTLGPF